MTTQDTAPLVTVVIAAYNAEAFVGAAVTSALRQTLGEIEVIVVDDGSSDRTAEVANTAAGADPRFVLLRLAANASVGAARNAGFAIARGTWLAILDADDTFAPERLERLVEVAKRTGADLVADNLTLHYPDGSSALAFSNGERFRDRPLDARRFVELDTPGLETLPAGYMQPIMRRSFLQRHGLNYPEGMTCGEDFHLYVRCLLRDAKLYIVPDAYYHAAVRAGSLSHTRSELTRRAMADSSSTLIAEARSLTKYDAARLLARRVSDVLSYDDYSRLSDALHRRRLGEAAALFVRLWSRSYTWRRLSMAVQRRVRVRAAAS